MFNKIYNVFREEVNKILLFVSVNYKYFSFVPIKALIKKRSSTNENVMVIGF